MEFKLEAYISEFVGTFFLVLTVGFNVLQRTALAPISIGCILMVMIFATGKVSGAHFNPAVTLGAYLRGKTDKQQACVYMLVQLLGGLVAGFTYVTVLGAAFTLQPGKGYGYFGAFIAEVLFTSALVFVVLSVATTTQDAGNWYYGLAIGFTVMAAAFAIGPISGACLNPAVALGVMMSGYTHLGIGAAKYFFLYTIAPLTGGCLASGMFYGVRRAEFKLAKEREPLLPSYAARSQATTSPAASGRSPALSVRSGAISSTTSPAASARGIRGPAGIGTRSAQSMGAPLSGRGGLAAPSPRTTGTFFGKRAQ